MKQYNFEGIEKRANAFLKRHGLIEIFDNVADLTTCGEFDHDGWTDESQTKGLGLQVRKNKEVYEVIIVKYTKKDIEKLEKEY